MRSPYEAAVWVAGMVAGSITYLRANLDLLDVNAITWDKVVGLFWGLMVAFFTGMFAVAGKRFAEWVIRWVGRRVFRRKK